MARKFTIGRQDEQSLNPELHDLFMSLKYVNKGYGEPVKDEQADIPVGSLWNDPNYGQNVMHVYGQQRAWTPMFKGYYHPANLHTRPANPVHGQIWIDEDNANKLFFYDLNTDSWIPVKAEQANPNEVGYGGYDNFINIFPLKEASTSGSKKGFIIPRETFGKLFDGGTFIHTQDSAYEKTSEVSINYTDKNTGEKESWVHVSPIRLNQCVKYLIKVDKDPGSTNPYEINLNPYNTEFYGISGKKGVLLRCDQSSPSGNDYATTAAGIRLMPKAYSYDYIMALSYSFHVSSRPGDIVKKSGTVGNDDEIYIGSYTVKPLVFLDGLYLEQANYTYDTAKGLITIVNDDIEAKMDMATIIFKDVAKTAANSYAELTINQANITNGTDAVVGTLASNAQAFKKPLAFISGVMGGTSTVSITDEVEINGANATIKNFGPVATGDTFKVLLVEADGMYIGSGLIGEGKTITHPDIDGMADYLLFVDGVLVTDRELEIAPGEIRTAGLVEGAQWLLLKTDQTDTILAFDSIVSDYTVKINHYNDASPYNNCDNAVVYVDGGVLVGDDTVDRQQTPKRGINGQVIRVKDNGSITHKIWSDKAGRWSDISDQATKNFIDGLCTFFYSRGSISIHANANGFVGKSYTYYAYTYNNSIDEPLLHSWRQTSTSQSEYQVNIDHAFVPNMGSLSMNLNNIYWTEFEEDNSQIGKFKLNDVEPISYIDLDGVDRSSEFPNSPAHPYDEGKLFYMVEKPESNEQVACRRIKLSAQDRNTEYLNAYNTPAGFRLRPGHVSIYVNGVRVHKSDYNIFNDDTIMFHFDLVGGQSHYDKDDPDTWKTFAFYEKGQQVKYMDCEKPDEILVEVREDYRMQSISITPRYFGQNVFSAEDDGIPLSLLATKDYLKVYINGAAYNGSYIIDRDAGLIILDDPSIYEVIGVDGMDLYLTKNPEEYRKYQENYGNYYRKKISDVITFEWR